MCEADEIYKEIGKLEEEVTQLEEKNESLMKLAGMYIKSYEKLLFEGGLEELEKENMRLEEEVTYMQITSAELRKRIEGLREHIPDHILKEWAHYDALKEGSE